MYSRTTYVKAPRASEHIAMINPIATLLTQMGHAFIDPGHASRLRSAVGARAAVILASLLIPAVFAVGWWVFTREAPRVAENLF